MIDINKLYGVVVWYNPTVENLDCIDSYVYNLKGLIIVDNSEINNRELLDKYNNIIYVPNLENKGIAYALNKGCDIAIKKGAEWLLTMDQDSAFKDNELMLFVEKANLYESVNTVGIFSPYQHYKDINKESDLLYFNNLPEFQLMAAVMTSGNILNLKVYQCTKGFRNSFFIDCVDDEYCCQMRRLNYEIIRINSVELKHNLGKLNKICIGKYIKTYIEHNPVRRYYIMRNNLYLKKLYPEMTKRCNRTIRKSIKRVLLYDWDNKYLKIKMMYRGWKDYKAGIDGKLK